MDQVLKIDRRKLLEIGKINHTNILDIGAGELAIIASEEFNCRVTSIDVSKSIIEDERKRVKRIGLDDKIKLEKIDATELPYKDDEFNAVISYGALHHNPIDKRDRFIEEAFRVAKEKLVVADFKEKYHIHPEDVHPPVNHDWLEKKLGEFGNVKRYEGKKKILYVCEF